MLYNKLYFYTATIHQWQTLIRDFKLEPIFLDSLSYLQQKGCIKVYGFVIMPNHIHLLWQLVKNNGKESPVASLMKFTAHRFEQVLGEKAPDALRNYRVNDLSRQFRFWQSAPDWFLLRLIPTIEQKLHYIHYNPMQEKWRLSDRAIDYPYSSLRFYVEGKSSFSFLQHYNTFVESELWVNE